MEKTTFEITYSYLTASGYRVSATMRGLCREEIEMICKRIESLDDYRLVDVSREYE